MNGNGNNGGGVANGNGLYPWLSQIENTNDGFRDQMMNDNITSIRDGIGNLATQLCNCCSDMQMSVTNGVNSLAQQMYGNTIADLERSFAAQTASTQGMNAIQSQLAQCCCDNRLATNDLKYTIATENCADRAALSDGIRDVITSQTANTQAILDKLCALELDGYKRENDQLRSQLTMANLAASQVEQTAALRTAGATIANQAIQEMRACPVPSTPVFGMTPIFTCPNNNYNNGCGCGCGA